MVLETQRKTGMTEFGKRKPFLFEDYELPSLPKMKKNNPCYESAVKRNLRSLFDRHEPGALAFLFCQLILRAFIESLYIIARTRTRKDSLRSLTYHRSLVPIA